MRILNARWLILLLFAREAQPRFLLYMLEVRLT